MTPERWNEVNDILHNYEIEDFQNPKEPLSAMRLLTKYYDEIMNGGFCQYFSNMESGYGIRDHSMLFTALKTVGMEEYIEITEKAIALYEKCESEDFDESEEDFDVQLDELGFEFDDNSAFINKLYSIADKHL